jgi:hypothetical protein
VGLCTGLLIVHGLLNSLATKQLAYITKSFVFINLGTTIGETPSNPIQKARLRYPWLILAIALVIIIVLLATTPRAEMHLASYVFGSEGVINRTGGWNTGIAFLFGLLSVQWTVWNRAFFS